MLPFMIFNNSDGEDLQCTFTSNFQAWFFWLAGYTLHCIALAYHISQPGSRTMVRPSERIIDCVINRPGVASTPLHYAALSLAQTVSKLSVTSWRKEGGRMSETSPRRGQCLIMILWMIHGVPVIDHGPKIQCVTFLRFSLFQNPAAMSLKVDKHFRSLTNMWKVDFL